MSPVATAEVRETRGFRKGELALGRPDVRQNPYPYYRWLQEQGPCFDAGGIWVVSRYEQVNALLRDRRFGADLRRADKPLLTGELKLPTDRGEGGDGAGESIADWVGRQLARPLEPGERRIVKWAAGQSMIGVDGEHHARQRKLVLDVFTPKAVARLEPAIRARTRSLLDAPESARRFDAIADFGYPLPLGVISDLLAIPASEQGRMRGWSSALTHATDPTASRAARRSAAWAALGFSNYLGTKIAERRRDPGDDLLSRLVAAGSADGQLSAGEMIGNIILLLVAGHETTTNLFGNGIWALLRNPDQYRRLREDRELLPGAIEEMLRYDSPGQLTYRTALEDADVGGVPIAAGEQLLLLTGAANSDPAVFPDPGRFEICRDDRANVSFGAGPHFCIGAPLARLEARVGFEELLDRGELRLAGPEPRYRRNLAHRGLESLPVRRLAA